MRNDNFGFEGVAPTFAQFATQAQHHRLEPRNIAAILDNGDTYAERLAFAKRVFDRRFRDNPIPYRSLRELYLSWIRVDKAAPEGACVCGKPLPQHGRSSRKFCSDRCRKRAARLKVKVPA